MPSGLDVVDARGNTEIFEMNASKQPVYHGQASPGTGEDKPGWRIRKFTYTGGVVTNIKWASGNSDFDKVWDDRAGYSYS